MFETWGPSVTDTDKIRTKVFTINLAQNAATYDLFTASGGDVLIQDITLYESAAGSGLTSVSVQSNDTTVTTVLSSAEGLLAGLTVGKTIKVFTTLFVLASTKKVQYTIVGTGSAGTIKAVVRYSPIVSGADIS